MHDSINDNCFVFQGAPDLIIAKENSKVVLCISDHTNNTEEGKKSTEDHTDNTVGKNLMMQAVQAGESKWTFRCIQDDHTGQDL